MSESPKTPAKQKPDPTVLGIRIERELKAKLGKLAQAERRTLSAQALLFIEEGVRHHEKGQKRAQGVRHP